MSSHGRGGALSATALTLSSSNEQLQLPRTVPRLLLSRSINTKAPPSGKPKLTKVLLNVTIQGRLGAVQVLMTLESSVGDLIAAAVKQYVKEGRRPILSTSVPSEFDLHYSQFSLESLNREEKLASLGSRNFFLCERRLEELELDDGCTGSGEGDAASSTRRSCWKEAGNATKSGLSGLSWLKFMNFLQ